LFLTVRLWPSSELQSLVLGLGLEPPVLGPVLGLEPPVLGPVLGLEGLVLGPGLGLEV